MAKDDGGPAFPKPQSTASGLTVRDWFAGQALAGFCALKVEGSDDPLLGAKDAALAAYNYADAMLAARAEKE